MIHYFNVHSKSNKSKNENEKICSEVSVTVQEISPEKVRKAMVGKICGKGRFKPKVKQ